MVTPTPAVSAKEKVLLPCPFCGGPARTFRLNGTEQATCAASVVDCAGSDVSAPVAMWNRRVALSTEGEAEPVAWMVIDEDGAVRSFEPLTAFLSLPAGGHNLYAHPPSAPAGVEDDAREFVAKVVYSAMKWAAERAEKGTPPEWVERGNSLAQGEARRVARNITDYVTASLQPDTKSTREGSLAQSNLMDGWTAMRLKRSVRSVPCPPRNTLPARRSCTRRKPSLPAS